jgi:hypothetical protein
VTDSSRKPARPVSVRKTSTGANGSSPGGAAAGVTPNSGNRPQTIIAAAVATVLSGLFAVIAALTLFGQHDFLTHQFNKQVLTSAEVTSGANAAAGAFDSAKKNHNAGKVSDALKKNLTDAKNESSRAVTDSDVTDQTKKATSAAKSAVSSTALASTVHSNLIKLQKRQRSDAANSVSKTPSQQLIGGVVLLLITGLIGISIWRGRYWSRWAVIAIWALSSFTGTTVAGINSLFAISGNLPGLFKTSIVLSSLAMLVSVVLVLLPASSRFFALSRPAPAAGGQRRGLFAPRVPASRTNATTRPASRSATQPAAQPAQTTEDPDRSRSKKRAGNAQAVAKGADLARRRAKAASKSRRTNSES